MRLVVTISLEVEPDEVGPATSRVADALRDNGIAVHGVGGLPLPAAPRAFPPARPDVELLVLPDSRRVLHLGRALPLSRREFDLLLFLCEHPDRVHGRRELISRVWGGDGSRGTRTVDVHVRRLRHKLGSAAGVITTVRGAGYLVEAGERVLVRRVGDGGELLVGNG